MDIVKRAYLTVKEDMKGDQDTWEFHTRVRAEIIRLIFECDYSSKQWPTELGNYPEELRNNRKI